MSKKMLSVVLSLIIMICLSRVTYAAGSQDLIEILSNDVKVSEEGLFHVDLNVKNISDVTLTELQLYGVCFDENGEIFGNFNMTADDTVSFSIEPDQIVNFTFDMEDLPQLQLLAVTGYGYYDSNGLYQEKILSSAKEVRFDLVEEGIEEVEDYTENTLEGITADDLIEQIDDLTNRLEILESENSELEEKLESSDDNERNTSEEDSESSSDMKELDREDTEAIKLNKEEKYALECIERLYNMLKDPSSMQIHSIQYLDGWCMVDYSAQNGFGGTNRGNYYFHGIDSLSEDELLNILGSLSSNTQTTIKSLTTGSGKLDKDKIMDKFNLTH